MDSDVFFKYWYAPLLSIVAFLSAVLIQNRQFRREDKIRKQEQEAEEISRRPNPDELYILRHCLEQPQKDGLYSFRVTAARTYINSRPVEEHFSGAPRDTLHSLKEKKYIEIFRDNGYSRCTPFGVLQRYFGNVLLETGTATGY